MIRRALALCAALAGTPALAADFRVEADPVMGCGMRMTGPVEEGDVARLRETITALELDLVTRGIPSHDPLLFQVSRRLCMDSPGGALAEGVAMARLLREARIGTAVGRGARCLSACAVAFMGGTAELEGRMPPQRDRVLHPLGTLGFHAPSLVVPEGRYGAQTVNSAYRVALASIALLQEAMAEIEFPQSLAVLMLNTPAEDFAYIETLGQAARAGIAIAPAAAPAELTALTADIACGQIQSYELDRPFEFLHLGFAPEGEGSAAISRDDNGRYAFAEAMLGAGPAGLSGCEIWFWPPVDGSDDPYRHHPVGDAGRISVGGANPFHASLLMPPETPIRDLALADDMRPEVRSVPEWRGRTDEAGECLLFQGSKLVGRQGCVRAVTTWIGEEDEGHETLYLTVDGAPLGRGIDLPETGQTEIQQLQQEAAEDRGNALLRAEGADEDYLDCEGLEAGGVICFRG